MIPIRWMAPETLRYNSMKFSPASDIWSFGVTLWEMYTLGQKPYFEMSDDQLLIQLPQGLTLVPPETCPAQMKLIMEKCWKFEPENRHTFEEIITVLQVETTKCSQTEIVLMPKTKKNTETNFKYTAFDTLLRKSNEPKITVTKEIQELHPLNGEKNNQIEKENLQKSRMISVRKCLKLLLIIIIFLVASGIVITLLISNLHGNDRINGYNT